MNITTIKSFFMWCSIINVAILLLSWILCVLAAGDWVYKIHSKLFPISREAFNIAVYSFLGLYKILTFVFCVIPYIALEIIG